MTKPLYLKVSKLMPDPTHMKTPQIMLPSLKTLTVKVHTRDKNFGIFGRFFAEISFFGEPRKKKCTEISFVRFFLKISDKFRLFPIFSQFFPFAILLQKSQKIVSGGIRTHPKCLEVAHSNHQAIDCTYYI